MSYTDKAKKKKEKVTEDEINPTVREQWNKNGGSANIRRTTQLINAICDKVGLK